MLLRGLRSALRSHADLALENLALRQQLAAFAHGGRRPRILATDRLFSIALSRLWSRWVDVLVFVKPETVNPMAPDGLPSLLGLALAPPATRTAID